MAQRPEPVGGFAGCAIAHAGFPQMPVGRSETPLDLTGRQRCKRIEETGPDLAGCAVLRDIFIGHSGQAHIVAHPLRHAPAAGTGLVSLTASLAISLVGVFRHPDSPPQAISSM